jgi:hypothetical protein
MIVTNKRYSHPRVTVIQIDIHLAGGNPTNTDGRGGQEARGWGLSLAREGGRMEEGEKKGGGNGRCPF